MDIRETRTRIDQWFPNLAAAGYEPTSDEDKNYNCIAWAAGETHRWWDDPSDGYYWPLGVVFSEQVDSLIQAFQSLGYQACNDVGEISMSYQKGVGKVAIYAKGDQWTHAARQLPNGRWASKLGDYEDIEHDKLEGFANFYGNLYCVMRKPPEKEIAHSFFVRLRRWVATRTSSFLRRP